MRARIELDAEATKEIWLAAVRRKASGATGLVHEIAAESAVDWAIPLALAWENTIPVGEDRLVAIYAAAKRPIPERDLPGVLRDQLADQNQHLHTLSLTVDSPWMPKTSFTQQVPGSSGSAALQCPPVLEMPVHGGHFVRFEWPNHQNRKVAVTSFPDRCTVDIL